MGTAIDESLENEIRVTVVATGLGNSVKAPVPAQAPAEIKVVKAAASEEEPDYNELAKPAVTRHVKPQAEPVSADGGYNEEMLDIPAFLRRQAD